MTSFKPKYKYVCQNCGASRSKWEGKCSECGKWNSFLEELSTGKHFGLVPDQNKIVKASEISNAKEVLKYSSGSREFDRALGGGLVNGSFVLIGGSPGVGKSTLLLQVSANLARSNKKVLYISSEESIDQTGIRAKRLDALEKNIEIGSFDNLTQITDWVLKIKPDVLIIDSIQTVYLPELASPPGSVSQVRECGGRLLNISKKHNITVFIVGHITKDGHLAGPKVLEHMVDTVLYFEGDANHQFRILRSLKNRFGSQEELGVFEMNRSGLVDVENPSKLFLEERSKSIGSTVIVSMEGTRPLLCEVQALSVKTYSQMPRRITVGIDPNRLFILMAVLDKFLKCNFATKDVFVNVVSGLKIKEPAADLSICAALLSTDKNICLKEKLCFFGEVGLTGQVRAVPFSFLRFKEAKKLGFDNLITSESARHQLSKEISKEDLSKIQFISHISELVQKIQ